MPSEEIKRPANSIKRFVDDKMTVKNVRGIKCVIEF